MVWGKKKNKTKTIIAALLVVIRLMRSYISHEVLPEPILGLSVSGGAAL